MKKCISFMHEKIMSTCNVAKDDDGEDADAECGVHEDGQGAYEPNEEGFQKVDLPGGVSVKEEDVAKGIDLNSTADFGTSNDMFVLALVIPCVSYQPPSAAMKVDLMKLYTSVTYFGVPYRYL